MEGEGMEGKELATLKVRYCLPGPPIDGASLAAFSPYLSDHPSPPSPLFIPNMFPHPCHLTRSFLTLKFEIKSCRTIDSN